MILQIAAPGRDNNDKLSIKYTCCVPDVTLSVLHIAIHLILTTNLGGKYSHFQTHFTHEETLEISSNLPHSHTSRMPFDPAIPLLGIN